MGDNNGVEYFSHWECTECGQIHGSCWAMVGTSRFNKRFARFCGYCGHKFENIPEDVLRHMENEEEKIQNHIDEFKKMGMEFIEKYGEK